MRRRGAALLPVVIAVLAIVEITLFVTLAHAIGLGWAWLLLTAVSFAGAVLVRREGIRGWRAFRAAAAEGRPPGEQVVNSLVGLGGALLLALPGFLTTVAGLLLLLPLRRVARRRLERYTERQVGTAFFGPRRVRVHPGDPVVVVDQQPVPTPTAALEGEVVER